MTERLTVRVIDRVSRVPASAWDALAPADDPFLRSAFLASVERSGAVGAAAGWAPAHVVVEEGGRPVAGLPTFLRGEDLSAGEWAAMHRFYRSTQHQHGQEGYLPERWRTDEVPALPDTLIVLARRGGVTIAGALNFTPGTSLYGRYWGADEEVRGLHFEVCYHALVEWALQNGVTRVEAGAQGEHKLQRGFLPRLTYSAHRIADPRLHAAVTEFCGREAEAVRTMVAEYLEHSPFSGGSAMRGGGA